MVAERRYPEVEVAGTPYEMGEQLGEAARELIRGFAACALERVRVTAPVSGEAALDVAHSCIPFARAYAPHHLEELEGVASSSGVALGELMLLQVRNQLMADDDSGCTSLAAASSIAAKPPLGGARSGLVGQNWDNDPELDRWTIVLRRRPVSQPSFISVTQAGLVAYIGVNDRGVGVCLNTLPAPSRRLGVPHYFIVRAMYETDSLDGVVDAARRAERAIPANVMLTTPDGPADLEMTIDDVKVLRHDQFVVHTNHCLHPDLEPINSSFPELIDSHARLARVRALRSGVPSSSNVETFKKLLRDHDNYPRSICRHPNDDPQHGFWRSVFSVVIEADTGRLHVSRGNPCENSYEIYEL